MSIKSLFGHFAARLQRKRWGARIPLPDGSTQDTGVDEFARELAALLGSEQPIPLSEPLKFQTRFGVPVFEVQERVSDEDAEAIGRPNSVVQLRFRDGDQQVVTNGSATQGTSETFEAQIFEPDVSDNDFKYLWRIAGLEPNGYVRLVSKFRGTQIFTYARYIA